MLKIAGKCQNVPHSIENFLTQIVTVKALDSCEYSLVAVKKVHYSPVQKNVYAGKLLTMINM